MGMQCKMRTAYTGERALAKARNRVKMGDIVALEGRKYKKVKNGWEEVDIKAYAKLIIYVF